MIWAFVLALLFVVFAWRPIYELAGDFLDYFFSTFMLVFFTAIVFGIGLLIALLIGSFIPKQWTDPETVKLVSMRDVNGIRGNFYLGTGSIGTAQYYFFYIEDRKGYRPGNISVDGNVIVYEIKKKGGELKIYTRQFVNPAYRWIALDWEIQRYEFIIPEGSLKKDFTL